ncbi:MAG: hypothetical protein ACM31L_09495 [Actinomycetota bacterium]
MKKMQVFLFALLAQGVTAAPAPAQYQSQYPGQYQSQSQPQSDEEAMARYRAQAYRDLQNSLPAVSSGEAFPTSPQPSLFDSFRGSQGIGAYSGNPYSSTGR